MSAEDRLTWLRGLHHKTLAIIFTMACGFVVISVWLLFYVHEHLWAFFIVTSQAMFWFIEYRKCYRAYFDEDLDGL